MGAVPWERSEGGGVERREVAERSTRRDTWRGKGSWKGSKGRQEG